MRHKLTPFHALSGLAALGALLLATPTDLAACPACNVQLTNEMEGERADSALAAEVRRAAANQAALNLGEGIQRSPAVSNHDGAPASEPTAAATAEPKPPAIVIPPGEQAMSVTPRLTAGSGPRYPMLDSFRDDPHADIIARDYGLSIPPTSYVPADTPADKSFTMVLSEGPAYIGNGVIYDGFLTNGTIPGPTLIVDEGDVVEFIVENRGTIPHGASIHAAYTQTSKYLGKIDPGQTRSMVFRATYPGVFLYHCAPGGHAIPMHVLFGQYGLMYVRPKAGSYALERDLGKKPDLEIYLTQHEFYTSGKDAIEGNAAYTTFNGKLFRYIEEPIIAHPGDFVRIHFLNVGPNLMSTFHIVGIVWDYAYWQGHPEALWPGGQSVTAGPTDSWIVEFRIPPDEGAYTMLSHAVGSTSRGAIGLIVADANAERTPSPVLADGPAYGEMEMAELKDKAVRVISPFKPGTPDVDPPHVVGPGINEVTVQIIGNSYHPKVLEITPGTTVTWINEEAFAYLAGEYSGVHNVAAVVMPDADENGFVSPLLVHAQTFAHTFNIEGEYEYICAPHPYMRGKIIVRQKDWDVSAAGAAVSPWWLLTLAGAAFLIACLSLLRRSGA